MPDTLSDTAIANLIRRHAAEGRFTRVEHDVPLGVGFGTAYIMPDGSTELVQRNGTPVPLQDTGSGQEILALNGRDRARFVRATFDLILEEKRRAFAAPDQKYDTYVLEKALQRLLTARAEWGPGELTAMVEAIVANYSRSITEIALYVFRHIRRYDLMTGEDKSEIQAAARDLRPSVQIEPYCGEGPVKKLWSVLDELMGSSEIVGSEEKFGV